MRFLTIAVVLTLSACAGDVERETPSAPSGPSQQYFDGYAEGCDSGYAAAGHPYYRYRKDPTRSRAAQFEQGWNDGFAKCKASHESNARR